MKASDVLKALVRDMDLRVRLTVPNVSHGLVPWGECDLLVMSSAGYLTEYEIKVSVADIRREWKKKRWANSFYRERFNELIKEYFMVVPAALLDVALKAMPEDVGGGIVVVDYVAASGRVGPRRVVAARINRGARALTQREQFKLARLGTLRYWSLMEKGYRT